MDDNIVTLRYYISYMSHKPKFDKYKDKLVKPAKGYKPLIGEYNRVRLEYQPIEDYYIAYEV